MADEGKDETCDQMRQNPRQEWRPGQSSDPKNPKKPEEQRELEFMIITLELLPHQNGNAENGTSSGNGPRQTPPSNTTNQVLATAAVGVAATALGVLAAPVVAGAALGAVGFTSAGVAAGSIAAGVQSAVYGGSVAAGSLFALCQSAGATGVIGSAATAAIAGGTGLAGIAATLGRRSHTIKLVICGGGVGTQVFSGIAFSQKDTEVRVLSLNEDDAKRWKTALQQKQLKVIFRCKGEEISRIVSKPALVSKKTEDVMGDAEMVVFMMQPSCLKYYLEALATHVKPGTIIVGLPGNREFHFQVRHALGRKAQQCTIMNFESLPWTCRTTECGVEYEVTRIIDTLPGKIKRGNVAPEKDPVSTLQYLLGPLPKLAVRSIC